jgi:cystathionine beta-lyase/cystathionine gamma-synthase
MQLPGSRSHSTEGNGYYLFRSGMVASSTNIWLMYLNNGQKNIARLSLFFLGYTVIDMIVHRGAYTHD